MANTYVYDQFFGLREHPFSITPDPRFVYLSDIHRTALEHLEAGATGGGNGFVLLTGDVGTGKTTICRTFLEKLPPKTEVALILNPVLTLNEFLQAICDELDLVIEGDRNSNKNLIDHLNRFLLQVYAVGQKTILIVDEAQNLSQELLEQIRLLTNLETATDKLLQIFLIGQPELREMLNRPEMAQLSQRITSRYHLGPLGKEDTRKYIRRRLEVAGAPDLDFASSGLRRIFAFSKGVPRVINVLCEKALICAYEKNASKIDAKIVKEAESRVVGNLPVSSGKFAGSSILKTVGVTVPLALILLAAAYWVNIGDLRSWLDERLGLVDQSIVTATNHDAPNSPEAAVIVPSNPAEPRTTVPETPGLPPDRIPVTPTPDREATTVQSTPPTDRIASTKSEAEAVGLLLPTMPDEPATAETLPTVASIPESAKNRIESKSAEPDSVSPASPSNGVDAAAVSSSPAIAASPPRKSPPSGDRASKNALSSSSNARPWAAAPRSAAPQQSLVDYTRSYAERKLLSMWGVTGAETVGSDFCQTAEGQGLTCLSENTGLSGLYLYDRPAIIFLIINNVSSYAVVLKASPESVVLDVLDQEHVIPSGSLREIWDGSFLLLWKQPQGVAGYLSEGATGPSALWVRRALDRIEGRQTMGNVFDTELASRVRRFQRTVGLAPDGIVGPRTFILLQNRIAESSG